MWTHTDSEIEVVVGIIIDVLQFGLHSKSELGESVEVSSSGGWVRVQGVGPSAAGEGGAAARERRLRLAGAGQGAAEAALGLQPRRRHVRAADRLDLLHIPEPTLTQQLRTRQKKVLPGCLSTLLRTRI